MPQKRSKNTAVDDDTLHLSLLAADCAYFFHKFKQVLCIL